MNKVIRTLILSDFLLLSGWGLLAPIFAIFITQRIEGGNAEVAGFAAGIYWITKSILQPFVGRYLDRNHGEKDDFWFLFTGLVISGFVPLWFIVSSQVWHIYMLQAMHAVGMAFMVPSFGGVFARHIDKGKEAFDYSMSSTAIGFGAGGAGIIGGWLAVRTGFTFLFLLTSTLTFFSAFILFFIANDLFPFNRRVPIPPLEKMPHIPTMSIFQRHLPGRPSQKKETPSSAPEQSSVRERH